MMMKDDEEGKKERQKTKEKLQRSRIYSV